jgi:hypothetical protein
MRLGGVLKVIIRVRIITGSVATCCHALRAAVASASNTAGR